MVIVQITHYLASNFALVPAPALALALMTFEPWCHSFNNACVSVCLYSMRMMLDGYDKDVVVVVVVDVDDVE